jgi:Protein of unknown function (DUF1573)
MKKSIYTFVLMALFGTAAFAQAPDKTAVDPNAAEISFDKEIHDFGTIEYGGDGVYDFKFTNTGKSPLIISNARGSCGCTVPRWPKEPIGKGESSVINVKYDTKRPGPFTKTVTIASNASTPSKVITIKGNVKPAPSNESQTPVKKVTGAPVEKAD